MTSTFENYDVNSIISKLNEANELFVKIYPGESANRQPVHTVYGGANLFKHNTAEKFGKLSQTALHQYAPNFVVLAHALKTCSGIGATPLAEEAVLPHHRLLSCFLDLPSSFP